MFRETSGIASCAGAAEWGDQLSLQFSREMTRPFGTNPDSGVGRGATTIGMDQLQSRASYASNRSNKRWLQLGNSLSNGGCTRSGLERRAHLTEMRALIRDLRLVIDVQVAGELDDPCHKRNDSEHRRPVSRAAAA